MQSIRITLKECILLKKIPDVLRILGMIHSQNDRLIQQNILGGMAFFVTSMPKATGLAYIPTLQEDTAFFSLRHFDHFLLRHFGLKHFSHLSQFY